MKSCTISNRPAITADRLCYLFLIFLAGCLVGWIYEEIFYWFTEGMLRNRGVLYGPWLPIYGIGALGIYGLKPLKKHPVLLFLFCVAVAALAGVGLRLLPTGLDVGWTTLIAGVASAVVAAVLFPKRPEVRDA